MLSRSESLLRTRFQPPRPRSNQAKRHKYAVPGKLITPGTALSSGHIDSVFCLSGMTATEVVLSLLAQWCADITLDNKNKVNLSRVPIASQRRVIMGLQRVRLPNHSFMIAPAHSLTPSVYMGMKIRLDARGSPEAVTRSGPMFIRIRSGTYRVPVCDSRRCTSICQINVFQP